MDARRWIVGLGLLLMLLLGGGLLLVAVIGTAPGRTPPCADLPSLAEAEAVLAGQQDLLAQVEALNPGFIFADLGTPADCPGRALLAISYATERDRGEIERLLRKSAGYSRPGLFSWPRIFGLPYRLVNT